MPAWLNQFLPILILLIVVAFVLMRLPRVELGHSDAFRRRRFWNWFPLGMTYAFLYMGRYNLAAVKDFGHITEKEYGIVFGVGAAVYGLSFFVNGPLTDRYGGRRTILLAAFGSAAANALMALAALGGALREPLLVFSLLYGANMYFQSFGAVSIVKVNAHWFHVRERGVFGGVFGILISLGVYFAFDWGHKIVKAWGPVPVFAIPAGILIAFWCIDLFLVHDSPSRTGHADFDVADASSGDDGPRLPALQVFRRIATNPVIVVITCIEFCSGFLRNAIMHWYRDFAKGLEISDQFVYRNWGMLLCMAGILGGMFAGVISDRIFHSRRGPVAAVLYGMMLAGALILVLLLELPPAVGWLVVLMSMCVIGVHGMLSGTASMDFGGRKNAGIAVGIIDGFVYFGTTAQSLVLGFLLPEKGTPEAAVVANWRVWPLVMVPAAAAGLLLALRVWHARPQPRKAAA